MSIWFESHNEIQCNIQKVKQSFNNYGEHYVGVISLMPGLTSVEFDEEYQAGRMISVKSHSLDEFTNRGAKVKHRIVLSEVKAPGLLGFFYRTFGKSSIGNSLLKSNKIFLEG